MVSLRKIFRNHFILFFLYFNIQSSKDHVISFIIPCYNREKVITQAIDSIYNQNLTIPFEIICTDDCSTDRTLAILLSYKKKYKNFFVYRHQVNKKAAAARNTAIEHAKGDLIFNLDSDNILPKNSIAPLITYLDRKGWDAVAFQEIRYFSKEKCPLRSYVTKIEGDGSFGLEDLLYGYKNNKIGDHGNYLFKKSAWKRAQGYPPIITKDCWGFTFRLLATGSKIGIMPSSYYWHRYSDDGTRRKYKEKVSESAVKVMREFPFLFTEETQRYINSPNALNNYYRDREKRTYKLKK